MTETTTTPTKPKHTPGRNRVKKAQARALATEILEMSRVRVKATTPDVDAAEEIASLAEELRALHMDRAGAVIAEDDSE